FCNLIEFALTKDVDLFAAVRTNQIAHVFNDADDRNVHQLCHFIGFFDDHRNQILWGGNDNNAVDRNGLENGQRNVAGAWRHIDEHIVYLAPDNIAPELFNGTCNDRTSPDNRIIGVFQQEVYRHDLGAVFGQTRVDAQFIALCTAVDAEHLWNGWTGDVCVQNGCTEASALHHDGQRRS